MIAVSLFIQTYLPTEVGSSPHCKTTFLVTLPLESTYTPSSVTNNGCKIV